MLNKWQNSDGFPRDSYFEAVESELRKLGVGIEHSHRDEEWDYTAELDMSGFRDGPMGRFHEVHIVWRCDEQDKPESQNDFTGYGWYLVPFSVNGALGDWVDDLPVPFLAEPSEVAEMVKGVLTGQRKAQRR